MSWRVDLRENSEDYFPFFFSYTPRYDAVGHPGARRTPTSRA